MYCSAAAQKAAFFVSAPTYLVMKGGGLMRKTKILSALILASLFIPQVAYAQTASGSVNNIVTFIKSIVGVLVTIGGILSVGFFAWGGIGYMTSSGNPEALERSKKTIIYSAVGLVIVLGSYIFSGIVTQLANSAGFVGQ